MKILHLSDLHGVERFYSWVSGEVRRTHYDALVVSGDLLNLFDLEYVEGQIGMVRDWSEGLPPELPVFLVSGNHDKLSLHLLLDKARWLRSLKRNNVFIDGESTELGGFCFECVGWGRVPVAKTKLLKILVSHSPPALSLAGTDCLGEDLGDVELTQHIQQAPCTTWLVLCGHVHEPKRWHDVGSICCLNPATSLDAKVPSHIMIDTEARTATRSGDGRSQTIRLP